MLESDSDTKNMGVWLRRSGVPLRYYCRVSRKMLQEPTRFKLPFSFDSRAPLHELGRSLLRLKTRNSLCG